MSDTKPLHDAPQSQTAGNGTGTGAGAPSAGSAPKVKPRNPAFVAMGLPRLRLPSRNWMIFFGVIGTWTALVQYDRREKRIATAKWRRLVADLKNDALPVTALPRKLTVVLAAPPADGTITAREHFHEYVKPVLEDSGLDWDAVEGRREGEVRAGLAEKIRKMRLRQGEAGSLQLEDWEVLLDDIRTRAGVRQAEGVAGDLVIGRHTWKEYVRGLHEGWLGPMNPPTTSDEDVSPAAVGTATGELAFSSPSQSASVSDDPLMLGKADDDASPTAAPVPTSSTETPTSETDKQEEDAAEEQKKKKKRQPPPFIGTSDYASATLSPNCPDILGPSEPVPMPHLLGFFNFPIRIYRYLHKRDLAETIGSQTAAAALAVYRPYQSDEQGATGLNGGSLDANPPPPLESTSSESSSRGSPPGDEVKDALLGEEKEWHKTIRNREGPPEQGREHTWTDDMVIDPRIASRLRRFTLTVEELERAKAIDRKIRQEKWDGLVDIPSRIWRGTMATFGGASPERHPLDTVGDTSDLD